MKKQKTKLMDMKIVFVEGDKTSEPKQTTYQYKYVYFDNCMKENKRPNEK